MEWSDENTRIVTEENLKTMFDITTDGSDRWNPSSGTASPSREAVASILNVDDIHDLDLDETDQESLANPRGLNILGRFIYDEKQKLKTCQVIQEQITKIRNIAERSQTLFEAFMKNDETPSVTAVMNEVIACGAADGSNEHFSATELFIKREQREMFLHMSEASRLCWLSRKYNVKYGHQ